MQEPSESADADITSKVNKAINTPMGRGTQHGTAQYYSAATQCNNSAAQF
jgi:hypothetical protein